MDFSQSRWSQITHKTLDLLLLMNSWGQGLIDWRDNIKFYSSKLWQTLLQAARLLFLHCTLFFSPRHSYGGTVIHSLYFWLKHSMSPCGYFWQNALSCESIILDAHMILSISQSWLWYGGTLAYSTGGFAGMPCIHLRVGWSGYKQGCSVIYWSSTPVSGPHLF
jgi:hypothetical protein